MSDNTYSRRVLTTYGILVDFEGEPHRTNVPAPLTGRKASKETMAQWASRVLGDEVTKVRVLRPTRVKSGTVFQDVQESHDASFVKGVISDAVRKRAKTAKEKLQEIKEDHSAEIKKRRSGVRELKNTHQAEIGERIDAVLKSTAFLPLDDLQDLVAELGNDLHPSVRDWAMRLSPKPGVEDLSVNDILGQMLRRMSMMAKG